MKNRKSLTRLLEELDRLAHAPVEQLARAEQLRPLFLTQRDPLLRAQFLLKVGTLGDTQRPLSQVIDDLLLARRIFRVNERSLEDQRCLARLAYWHNRQGLPAATLLAGRMALEPGGLPLAERALLVVVMCLALAAQRQLPTAWALLDELAAPMRAVAGEGPVAARLQGTRASLHFVEALRACRIESLYSLDLPPGEPDVAARDHHLEACEQQLRRIEGAGPLPPAARVLAALCAALRGDAEGLLTRLGPAQAQPGAEALGEGVRLYNLGWGLRVLGRPDAAQAACRQALVPMERLLDNRNLLLLRYELSLCERDLGRQEAAYAELTAHLQVGARLAGLDLQAVQALVEPRPGAAARSTPQADRAGPAPAPRRDIAPPPDPAAAAFDGTAPLRATEPPCLARAEHLLLAQLPRRLPLTRLAEQVGVSLRTLQAAAQGWRGMTLTQMLRARLMAEALRLLADTDASLREIALRLGYADPNAFSRDFKRVYGASPRLQRGLLASGADPAASPRGAPGPVAPTG